MTRAMAADGEGASKLLEVVVTGAPSDAAARDVARSIANSPLVKAALFGADPNWGRVLATVGSRAGTRGWLIDPYKARVLLQGVPVFASGAPTDFDREALKARMREPSIDLRVELADGDVSATAWGCDLSYDYVKINADYSSQIVQKADGGMAREDHVANYSPAFKRALLAEALKYIAAFSGTGRGHQVRRRSHGEGVAEGGLRGGRGAAQAGGAQAGGGPRRRPGGHPHHGAAGRALRVRGRAAHHRRDVASGGGDGPHREGEPGAGGAAQPAQRLGGGTLRQGRAAPAGPQDRPRERPRPGPRRRGGRGEQGLPPHAAQVELRAGHLAHRQRRGWARTVRECRRRGRRGGGRAGRQEAHLPHRRARHPRVGAGRRDGAPESPVRTWRPASRPGPSPAG